MAENIKKILEQISLPLIKSGKGNEIYEKVLQYPKDCKKKEYHLLEKHFLLIIQSAKKHISQLTNIYSAKFKIRNYKVNKVGLYNIINDSKCLYNIVYYYKIDKDARVGELITYDINNKVTNNNIPEEGSLYTFQGNYSVGHMSSINNVKGEIGIVIIELNLFE